MKKIVALVLAGCLVLASQGFAINPGATAPNFTLPDTADVNHSLSDFAGKTVFANWWTST